MASPVGMVGSGSYGPVSDAAVGVRVEPYGTPEGGVDTHGFRMKAPPLAPPATMAPPLDQSGLVAAPWNSPATAPAHEQSYEQRQMQTSSDAATEVTTEAIAAAAAAALAIPAPGSAPPPTAAPTLAMPLGLTAATAPEAGQAATAVPQYTLATLMPGMGGQYVLAQAPAAYYQPAASQNAALQQYIAAAYPTLDATQQAALVQYYSQINQVASAQASGGLATVISGGYPLVATTGPSNAWISNRLIEREKARIEKKYDEADKLRKLLRTNGIEVDDRDRSWTSRDGRRGPRPNHNDPMEEENEGATLISATQLSSLLPQMSMPTLASAVPAAPALPAES